MFVIVYIVQRGLGGWGWNDGCNTGFISSDDFTSKSRLTPLSGHLTKKKLKIVKGSLIHPFSFFFRRKKKKKSNFLNHYLDNHVASIRARHRNYQRDGQKLKAGI